MSNNYSEQTIYSGFIYYCKYYYVNETDDLIKSLCGEPLKDVDYSKNIDEIIEIYKRDTKIKHMILKFIIVLVKIYLILIYTRI